MSTSRSITPNFSLYVPIPPLFSFPLLLPEDLIEDHHWNFIHILDNIGELQGKIEKLLDTIKHTIDTPENHRYQRANGYCHDRKDKKE